MANRSQEPSFKTDVHRMQTQRWKEAKSYSYDGGDWDDYDEYEEHEEPPLPSKPTGLRQRGQSSASQTSGPVAQKPAPPPLQQPQQHQQYHTLRPQGSFEVGDDRRDFSGSSIPSMVAGRRPSPTSPDLRSYQRPSPTSSTLSENQSRRPSVDPQVNRRPSPASPASASSSRRPSADANMHRSSPTMDSRSEFPGPNYRGPGTPRSSQLEIFPGPRSGTPNASGGRPYLTHQNQSIPQNPTALPQRPRTSSRGQVDVNPRTGYPQSESKSGGRSSPATSNSTAQVPQTRGPGVLPVDQEPLPHAAFPPRKESLRGTNKRPSLSSLRGNQRPGSRNESPARQSSTPSVVEPHQPVVRPPSREGGQPLQRFVRPADIYRRIEDEREKERQSLDSGRPSIEAIERARRTPSGDAMREQDTNNRLKPTLDTVAERKSEYGMDGFALHEPTPKPSGKSELSLEPPSLPQLSRFSGFGNDLLGGTSLLNENGASRDAKKLEADPVNPREPGEVSHSVAPSADLQHHPSLGFQSAVEQAFDGNAERGLTSPMSLHGSQRSTDGSETSKSGADSTAGISPIVSRVPSGAATSAQKARERDLRNANTPSIAEDANESTSPDSRPTSNTTLKGPQQPAATSHDRMTSGDSGSSVKSALRRDLNNASPSNVSMRTPEIQTLPDLQQSAEGELAMTTPVESLGSGSSHEDHQTQFARRESDLASEARERENPGVAVAERQAQSNFIQSHPAGPSIPPLATYSVPRVTPSNDRDSSPAKGRVKDLASKYHKLHQSSRSATQSPTGSVSSWGSSNVHTPAGSPDRETSTPKASTSAPDNSDSAGKRESDAQAPRQTLADLAPPPRPKLPGAWVSYAPSEASDDPSAEPSDADEHEPAQVRSDDRSNQATPKIARGQSKDSVDFAPTTAKRPLSGKTIQQPLDTPMGALASAGSALAESLKQSVGMTFDEGESESEASSGHVTPGGKVLRAPPMDARPPPVTSGLSSSVSTVAPTPPAKDTPQEQRSSGYFPALQPLSVRNRDPSKAEAQDREYNSASSSQPPSSTQLSAEPAFGDTESDRLRKDIYRSLEPSVPEAVKESPPQSDALRAHYREGSSPRASTVIPHEYESYWEGTSSDNSPQGLAKSIAASEHHRSLSDDRTGEPFASGQIVSPLEDTQFPQPPPNLKRFSWEGSQQSLPSSAPVNGERPEISRQVSSPMTGRPEDSSPAELEDSSSGKIPRQFDLKDVPPAPIELANNDSDQESARSPADRADDASPSFLHQPSKPKPSGPTSQDFPPSSQHLSASRLPAFREILQMKHPHERIESLQTTRDQVARQDNGLNGWLSNMADKYPELATQQANSTSPLKTRPMVFTSGLAGSMRTRIPPLSKFAKSGGVGDVSANSTGTPESAISPHTAGIASPSGSRRKELLTSAGAFGGKATTGARGLLAKGKSRFRPSTEKAKQVPPVQDFQPSKNTKMWSFSRRCETPEKITKNAHASAAQDGIIPAEPVIPTAIRTSSPHDADSIWLPPSPCPRLSTPPADEKNLEILMPSSSAANPTRDDRRSSFSPSIQRLREPPSRRGSKTQSHRYSPHHSTTHVPIPSSSHNSHSRSTSSSGEENPSIRVAVQKDGSPRVLALAEVQPVTTTDLPNEEGLGDDGVVAGKWKEYEGRLGLERRASDDEERAATVGQLREALEKEVQRRVGLERDRSEEEDEEGDTEFGARGFGMWKNGEDATEQDEEVGECLVGENVRIGETEAQQHHEGSSCGSFPSGKFIFTSQSSAIPLERHDEQPDDVLGLSTSDAMQNRFRQVLSPQQEVPDMLTSTHQSLAVVPPSSRPQSQTRSYSDTASTPGLAISHSSSRPVSVYSNGAPSRHAPPLPHRNSSGMLPHRQSTTASLTTSRPGSLLQRGDSQSSIGSLTGPSMYSSTHASMHALTEPRAIPTDDVRGAHAGQPYREERRKSSDALLALTQEATESTSSSNICESVQREEEKIEEDSEKKKRNRLYKKPPTSISSPIRPAISRQTLGPNVQSSTKTTSSKRRSSFLGSLFGRGDKNSKLTKQAPSIPRTELPTFSSHTEFDTAPPLPAVRSVNNGLGQRYYSDRPPTSAGVSPPRLRPTLPVVGSEDATSLRHFIVSSTDAKGIVLSTSTPEDPKLCEKFPEPSVPGPRKEQIELLQEHGIVPPRALRSSSVIQSKPQSQSAAREQPGRDAGRSRPWSWASDAAGGIFSVERNAGNQGSGVRASSYGDYANGPGRVVQERSGCKEASGASAAEHVYSDYSPLPCKTPSAEARDEGQSEHRILEEQTARHNETQEDEIDEEIIMSPTSGPVDLWMPGGRS